MWFRLKETLTPSLELPFLVLTLAFSSLCAPKQNIDSSKDSDVDFFCNAGEAVTVEDEVVVTNSIVLPNKTLNVSVQEEIIL